MLKQILLLALVAVCSGDPYKKLFKQYADIKVYKSCFGVNLTENYYRRSAKYYKDCYLELKANHTSPKTKATTNSTAYYNVDKIHYLRNKLTKEQQMLSCVLKKFDFMDDNTNIKFDSWKKAINALPIDAALKTDLNNNIDECSRRIDCPMRIAHLPASPKMVQVYQFLHCERTLKWVACIKHELRGATKEFELQGLDGIMDGIDKVDQMFAVMTADSLVRPDVTFP